MALALTISLSISAGLFVLSLLFKVSGKLRLTIPLIYFLVAAVSTLFTDWASKHEQLVFVGLYVLLGLVALSWIVSLVKVIQKKRSERAYGRALEEDVAWQIQRARELGIPLENILILEDGTIVDADTHQPIIPVKNYGKPLN